MLIREEGIYYLESCFLVTLNFLAFLQFIIQKKNYNILTLIVKSKVGQFKKTMHSSNNHTYANAHCNSMGFRYLGESGNCNKYMKMLYYLICQIKTWPENFFFTFISFIGGMVPGV